MAIALRGSGSIKLTKIRHVSDRMQVAGAACSVLESRSFPASVQCSFPSGQAGVAAAGLCWSRPSTSESASSSADVSG